MAKILIIGQAPPAQKQTVPYDTTLLYEMLSWIGISKDEAQNIFEFEAMTDKFPGHGINGHLKPSMKEMKEYYNKILKAKIEVSGRKIIVLGNVAKDALLSFGIGYYKQDIEILFLMHPSRRNYNLIMNNKENISSSLQRFIK